MKPIQSHGALQRINNLLHPERFQGWGRQRGYFEGWYFKLIAPEAAASLAIIPGVAMDLEGKQHAFIQVLDGRRKTSTYHRFPIENFLAVADRFEVAIGDNHFSAEGITLALQNLSGTLRFSGQVPWPKRLYSPGIMGPFTFVPYMECYHGIVSMDHRITGKLLVNGADEMRFDGGRGYLEKDWGRSFPSGYIWMQSNHFEREGISFKCSVARIPWLNGSFTGFIAGLWLDGQLIRFTTYNRCALRLCYADLHVVRIMLEHPAFRLEVEAERDAPTALASPIQGLMDGRIEETMQARISIRLIHKASGQVRFEGQGIHGGLEVAGDVQQIMTNVTAQTAFSR